MIRHIIKISFILSVLLIISCAQSETPETQENEPTVVGTSSDGEAPKKEFDYPAIFNETDVPLMEGSYLLNKKELKNTKNMAGMQLWERSDKNFESVKDYYLETLQNKGWERRTDADKQSTVEQETDIAPVKYFVTKFHKKMPDEKKRYVLLINVSSNNEGKTTVMKIIKEM